MNPSSIVQYDRLGSLKQELIKSSAFQRVLDRDIIKYKDLDVAKRSQLLDRETSKATTNLALAKVLAIEEVKKAVKIQMLNIENTGLKQQLGTEFSPEELQRYCRENAFRIATPSVLLQRLAQEAAETMQEYPFDKDTEFEEMLPFP